MRITEKAGELNKVFELQFSRLAPIKCLEKKGKEIFKHNMSEDGNSKLKFC